MKIEYYIIIEDTSDYKQDKPSFKISDKLVVNADLSTICGLGNYSGVYDACVENGWCAIKIENSYKYKIFVSDYGRFLSEYQQCESKNIMIREIRNHKLKSLIK